MVPPKYLKEISQTVKETFPGRRIKVFLFGSAVRERRFGDCDLGLLGKVTGRDVRALKERFSSSTFPYSVDVVNFNAVSNAFKTNVFKQPIVWIKR